MTGLQLDRDPPGRIAGSDPEDRNPGTAQCCGLPALGLFAALIFNTASTRRLFFALIACCAIVTAAFLCILKTSQLRLDQESCFPDLAQFGLYQIDELQARSWMLAGSPFGMAMPRRAASMVLQREVGISSTRA